MSCRYREPGVCVRVRVRVHACMGACLCVCTYHI